MLLLRLGKVENQFMPIQIMHIMAFEIMFALHKDRCQSKLSNNLQYRKVSNNGRGYYYIFTEYWSDFSTKMRLLIEVRLLSI